MCKMFDFCLEALERKMKTSKKLPRQLYLADFFVKKYNKKKYKNKIKG
jgi:hypothetical protein